jgi:hypothetical protein
VRLALVENEQRIRQAARNIRKFMEANGVKTKPDKESRAKPEVAIARKAAG